MNADLAALIAKYEAALSADGVSLPTTETEDALVQEAVLQAWSSLGTRDRECLARYWKTPEAGT